MVVSPSKRQRSVPLWMTRSPFCSARTVSSGLLSLDNRLAMAAQNTASASKTIEPVCKTTPILCVLCSDTLEKKARRLCEISSLEITMPSSRIKHLSTILRTAFSSGEASSGASGTGAGSAPTQGDGATPSLCAMPLSPSEKATGFSGMAAGRALSGFSCVEAPPPPEAKSWMARLSFPRHAAASLQRNLKTLFPFSAASRRTASSAGSVRKSLWTAPISRRKLSASFNAWHNRKATLRRYVLLAHASNACQCALFSMISPSSLPLVH